MTVPHAWQELDGYRDYLGTAWYRRRFEVDDAPDAGDSYDRYVLHSVVRMVVMHDERSR